MKLATSGIALILSGLMGTGAALAAPDAYQVELPSGITAEFIEAITDQPAEGLTYRFRFASKELPTATEGYENQEADMMYLCKNFALDRLPNPGPRPKHVVISIADRVEKFGVYNIEITQYFDSFDVSSGDCEWEFY